MIGDRPSSVFLCNGACLPDHLEDSKFNILEYRSDKAVKQNVRMGLPNFVLSVFFLPDRCLDLIEIAAYIFAADRLTHRGSNTSIEYQSWARNFHFVIRVRDYEFWSTSSVQNALSSALDFVTGDWGYTFTFQPGHHTPPTSLFDQEQFQLEATEELSIVLFSGGLDSLTGAVQRLQETEDRVCLISHQSRGGIVKTQRGLVDALKGEYRGRVEHYKFRTNLKGVIRREESQRSRSFLFGSIAFAIAKAYSRNEFFIYENGVTSLNFERREELLNARASRTTHPQTISRLAHLFAMISEKPFTIKTPFLWNTKTEVVEYLKSSNKAHLIPSSVSCSHSIRGQITHCGQCFQCLDRRIGIYGSSAHESDNIGLYETDIINSGISSKAGKTTVVDYLRQAANFSNWSQDRFTQEVLDDLQFLLECIPGHDDEFELVEKVWDLCCRHGQHVFRALRSMRDIHETLFRPLAPDSLLEVVSDREFLKEPIERLVSAMQERLATALPKVFQSVQPANEADLNDKVEGLLDAWRDELLREHPSVPFACAGVVPDFSSTRAHLLIEGKYIRKGTPPSKVNEGMAADLTKYPQEAHILFVVYDFGRAIKDRDRFKRDFETKGRCTVCLLP